MFIQVNISVVTIACKNSYNFVKRPLLRIVPGKRFVAGQFNKRSKNVSATREKRLVKVYSSNQRTSLCGVLGMLHFQDYIDLVFHRMDEILCHPKSQEISFLYGPITFERVALESIFGQAGQDFVDKRKMMFERAVDPNTTIIDVDDDILAYDFKTLIGRRLY